MKVRKDKVMSLAREMSLCLCDGVGNEDEIRSRVVTLNRDERRLYGQYLTNLVRMES